MNPKSVLKITVAYLIFGLLWIYFSDKLLDSSLPDGPSVVSEFQTYKGFFYVGFTTLLLYMLIRRYSRELNEKVIRLQESEQELIKSEEKYKMLFESSPMPVFIYHPETDRILEVNNTAVSHYGYTPDEFSTMTILQIEHDVDVDMIEEKLNIPKRTDMIHSTGIHMHKKKDGDLIYVYLQGTNIHYKGQDAQIVIANDITQQIQYIEAIEKQNTKLNEIAWMQSHVVRAPLASLMGLIHILKDQSAEQDNKEILHKLLSSANDLDQVIRKISDNADTTEYNINS